MWTISKTFSFDASHALTHLPSDHKCSRLHGHTYTVAVTLASDWLDSHGMVWDYAHLNAFRDWLNAEVDHRHLNDVVGTPRGTTAEALAEFFALILLDRFVHGHVRLVSVMVCETPKTSATYHVAPR